MLNRFFDVSLLLDTVEYSGFILHGLSNSFADA